MLLRKFMIKHRISYWSCSKFADFVRGEKKPYALPWEEWDIWKKEQQEKRSFRYWLSDTFLDNMQDVVYFPSDVYYQIKYYIKNRWIDKTHYLKTGLKVGQWHDLDTRIIYGIFNELVDYVEIELAHLSKWNKDKKYKFKNGRCVEAAYDYFNWAEKLKDSPTQSENAKVIREIYEWWTITRPNRPDPYVDDDDGIFSRPLLEEQKQAIKINHDIEESYDNEDSEMLIKLIKIRKGLWS